MDHTIESLGFNATLDELLTLIDPRIAEAVYAHHAELEEQRDNFEAQYEETESDLQDAVKRIDELEETVSDLEDQVEELEETVSDLEDQLEAK